MEIYLIRHAEMVGDPHRFYDPPVEGCLSDLGVRQSEALARALDGHITFDAIYSSPLGRAVQTAQTLARRRGTEVEVLPWIREWIPATVTGEAGESQFERIMEAAERIPPEQAWKTPAGEGTYEMAHRIVPPLLDLLSAHGLHAAHGGYLLDEPDSHARIAIVAHGGSLSVLLGFILDLPLRPYGRFAFRHTGMAVVEFVRRADVWYPMLRVGPPYPHLPS